MVLTGVVETGIAYGAEAKNAQMATIEKGGKIPLERVQNPMVPWGPGVSLHIARNALAMIGMRTQTCTSDPGAGGWILVSANFERLVLGCIADTFRK